MAKIDALPSPIYIFALKRTIDYAVWRGVPYARGWPRRPRMPRAPAVRAAGRAWAALLRSLNYVDPEIKTQAEALSRGTVLTWRDLLIKAAYGRLVTW